MVAFQPQLTALGYPHATSFDPKKSDQVHTLLVWLEMTKIRVYDEEQRDQFSKFGPSWEKEVRQYLEAVNYPRAIPESIDMETSLRIVGWILEYAIGLEYRDNAAEYTTYAESNASLIHQSSEQDGTSKHLDGIDTSSPKFIKTVQQLAQTLQLPLHDDTLTLLQAIARTVRTRFSPHDVQTAIARAQSSDNAQKDAIHQELGAFPLGFATGDAMLDKAATVLRLMYISDLRDVQTSINEIIVAIQELTANPKTDAKLGKVGY